MPKKTRPKTGYRLATLDEMNLDDLDLTDDQERAILRAALGDAEEQSANLRLVVAVPTTVSMLIKRYRIDRRNQALRPTPQQTAATLTQLREAQASLSGALDTLTGDSVTFSLLADQAESWGNGVRDIRDLQRLNMGLGSWLRAAAKRAPSADRGPVPDFALRSLISNLAALWKDTMEQELSRSYKSEAVGAVAFVRAVVGIADPDKSTTDIDTAMKAVLSKRGE